jgi:4-amino-4-deoxy-L-arabinose transferase-like glycosyltransferase
MLRRTAELAGPTAAGAARHPDEAAVQARLSSSERARIRAWTAELALVLGLGGLALALRFPNYQLIPAFTDEVDEIYRAVQVARGELLPFTNVDAYIGSLWNYVLAAAFWIGGFSLTTPRTMLLAAGVLTVLATYLLGRAWSGGSRLGGALAALLLATSAEHIVVNSRLAWSNSITPLFSTLGVWALWLAVAGVRGQGPGARGSGSGVRGPETEAPVPGADDALAVPSPPTLAPGPWSLTPGPALLLAGLFWGLAFQTHPTILAPLFGAGLFGLWRGRRLLRTRWLPLAIGLFLLMNLNLVVYNLTNDFDSVHNAIYRASTPAYSNRQGLSPAVYLVREARLQLGLFRHLGGAVDAHDITQPWELLGDPGLWPIALLALVGLGWQWQRGNPLPTLLLISVMLLLPLFNGRYLPILDGRYLTPMLPVLFAGIAALLAAGWQRRPRWRIPLAQVGLALAAAFVILHPLLYLQTYYQQEQDGGRTNAEIFQTMDQIRPNHRKDELIVVDPALRFKRMNGHDGALDSILRTALAVEGYPFRLPEPNSGEGLGPNVRCRNHLMLLAPNPTDLRWLLNRLGLEGVRYSPSIIGPPAQQYALYQLDRLSNDHSGC